VSPRPDRSPACAILRVAEIVLDDLDDDLDDDDLDDLDDDEDQDTDADEEDEDDEDDVETWQVGQPPDMLLKASSGLTSPVDLLDWREFAQLN
jgi:hypothetical protein